MLSALILMLFLTLTQAFHHIKDDTRCSWKVYKAKEKLGMITLLQKKGNGKSVWRGKRAIVDRKKSQLEDNANDTIESKHFLVEGMNLLAGYESNPTIRQLGRYLVAHWYFPFIPLVHCLTKFTLDGKTHWWDSDKKSNAHLRRSLDKFFGALAT